MGANTASAFFFWRCLAIHIPEEDLLSLAPLWVHPIIGSQLVFRGGFSDGFQALKRCVRGYPG